MLGQRTPGPLGRLGTTEGVVMHDMSVSRTRPRSSLRPTPKWHQVAVLIPTRDEMENVLPLVTRMTSALEGLDAEIVFVDDSDDDTPLVVQRAAAETGVPIRLIHRPKELRIGGLGGAVKTGAQATESAWIVVMDGDLQHPPELIPHLLALGIVETLEVVVASRYCGGGKASGLGSTTRHFVSSGATALARFLFPVRLRRISDPMSGFFALRRSALDLGTLRPDGFKILLEVLARKSPGGVGELPFVFGERSGGKSKASWREGSLYLRRLVSLRLSALPVRSDVAIRCNGRRAGRRLEASVSG